MALGEGFKGRVECPIWLLDCAEAMVIPLGKNRQTNPVYSRRPGQAASSMLIPNCKEKRKAWNFTIGQMNDLTFLTAEIFLPQLNRCGWINLWQGASVGTEGTMYCEVEYIETQNTQCRCGLCQASWAQNGWICPEYHQAMPATGGEPATGGQSHLMLASHRRFASHRRPKQLPGKKLGRNHRKDLSAQQLDLEEQQRIARTGSQERVVRHVG